MPQFISAKTIMVLYGYLQSNGGSYNDLSGLFQFSDIMPDKEMQSTSTRNKDQFLDKYIKPLDLSNYDDARKLVQFITLLEFEVNTYEGIDSELLKSIQNDGWFINSATEFEFKDESKFSSTGLVQMPSDIEKLLSTLIKGIPKAIVPLTEQKRRKNSLFIKFDNEYDIQDLLETLMRPWINDIRPEEYASSSVGKSPRIDFVLPEYRIVIEVKYVRDKPHAKAVGDELLVDCARYVKHESCEQLWIVIYDPERLINNPDGFKNDLAQSSKEIVIKTFILF